MKWKSSQNFRTKRYNFFFRETIFNDPLGINFFLLTMQSNYNFKIIVLYCIIDRDNFYLSALGYLQALKTHRWQFRLRTTTGV